MSLLILCMNFFLLLCLDLSTYFVSSFKQIKHIVRIIQYSTRSKLGTLIVIPFMYADSSQRSPLTANIKQKQKKLRVKFVCYFFTGNNNILFKKIWQKVNQIWGKERLSYRSRELLLKRRAKCPPFHLCLSRASTFFQLKSQLFRAGSQRIQPKIGCK